MAKTPTEIRSIARSHCANALNVLEGIMNQPKAPHSARVAAANSLLDRGLGKATQLIAGDDEHGAIRFESITDEQRAQAVAALLAKATNGHAVSDTAIDD